MDLIRPETSEAVAEALGEASAAGVRVVVSGAGLHAERGPGHAAEMRLDTTALSGLVHYEPAEMIAVVAAGTRVGDLAAAVAEGGQEWASDAPDDATVGGVLAAALSSPRRLRVGPVRDSLLEVVVATGDGRLVKGGGRVVKNVTGYDLPRLMVGSLGTLGLITQVALKLRPLPRARRTLAWETEEPFALGAALLRVVPLPAAVVAHPERVEIHLEGWPAEVDEQAAMARGVAEPDHTAEAMPYRIRAPWQEMPGQLEAGVVPSRLPDLAASAERPAGRGSWSGLLGVGLFWAGSDDPEGLTDIVRRAEELGGHAILTRGGSASGAPPAAPVIHERLKAAFDPAGILPSLVAVPA